MVLWMIYSLTNFNVIQSHSVRELKLAVVRVETDQAENKFT